MEDSGFVRVRSCSSGRVHVQIGYVTMCLEPDQLAELVGKGQQALELNSRFEDRAARWPSGLPQ